MTKTNEVGVDFTVHSAPTPLVRDLISYKEKNMTNSKESCCTGDVVSTTLGKVGVNRSLLITLALIPFAWEGVNWVAGAVRELWNLIASV